MIGKAKRPERAASAGKSGWTGRRYRSSRFFSRWAGSSAIVYAISDNPKSTALIYPALDLALKCSHVFNLMDARGAVGVTQRAEYINRIRASVRACCLKYLEQYKEKAVA